MPTGEGNAWPQWRFAPSLEWEPGVQRYFDQVFGEEKFRQISRALRQPPLTSCIRVNTLQADVPSVIAALKTTFCDQSQSATSDLLSSVPPGSIREHPELPGVIEIQGSGPHAVDYSPRNASSKWKTDKDKRQGGGGERRDGMGKREVEAREGSSEDGVGMGVGVGVGMERVELKEVLVSRKCGEAVLRGAQVFIPGVLACSGSLEAGDWVGVSVAIEHRMDGDGDGDGDGEERWKGGCTRGAVLGSEHAETQLGSCDRSRWFIGCGQSLASRSSLFRSRSGVAVRMAERVYALPPCNGVLLGQTFVQNLPSIVAARVLGPVGGERILDMCAAPGGKTTAIAILMGDEGEVVALDRSHTKVAGIASLASEMGLTCIRPLKMNALNAVVTPGEQRGGEEGAKDTTLSSSPGSKATHPSPPPTHHMSPHPNPPQSPHISSHPTPYPNPSPSFHMSSHPSTHPEPHPSPHPSPHSNPHPSPHPSPHPEPHPDPRPKDEHGRYLSRAAERKGARRRQNGEREREREGKDGGGSVGFLPGSFHRVLLDAPCSALGLRPRLFAGETSLDELRKHAVYQKRLVDQAVRLVAPGGTLVYSTCTINPGENEGVVRYALDRFPFLKLVPQEPLLGGPGLVGGADVFDGVGYREWLRPGEEHLVQRFDPLGPRDTIGFFIAKFEVGATGSHD